MPATSATLAQLLGALDTHTDDDPAASDLDWIVSVVLPHVTDRIEHLTSKEYHPRRRTRRWHAYGHHLDDLYHALLINQTPLLSITALTIGGVTLESGHYQFIDDEAPYWRVALTTAAPVSWDYHTGDWLNSIAIDGVYAYRRGQGWKASGQTVQDIPLSSSAVSLTVTSSAVFSPGQMLQIEDEWLAVDAVPDATHITVERGVRGSNAAAHNQNTAISIWWPQPEIVRAASQWGAFLFRNRGNFASRRYDAMGGAAVEVLPDDAPTEVANILDRFFDWSFATGEE